MSVQQLSERRSPHGGLSVSPCSSGPALVVVVGGEADWATADQLREGLTAALSYGPRSLVLDLTDLEFCNLHGLRALMGAVETAERAGVDVTVHGMSPQLSWLADHVPAGSRRYGRRSGSGPHGAGAAPAGGVRPV